MRSSAPVLLSFLSIALSTGAYYSPLSSRDTPGRLNLDLLERDLLEDPLYARAISTYITGVIVAREAEAEAKAFAKAEAKRDAWAEAQNEAKALSNLEDQFPVPGSSNPKSGTPVSKSGKSSKGKKTYQGRNSREPAGKEPVDNLPVLPLAARSSDAVASSPADQAAQYVQEQQLEHPLTFNQNSSPDGKNSQSQQNTRRSTFPDALEDIENLPPGARSADASSTLERTGPAYGQGTYPATVPGEKQGGKKSKKSSQSQQNTRRSPSPDTFEDIENLRLAARSANAEGQINGQDIPESLLNSPKTTNPSWYQQTSNPNGKSSKGKKSSQPQNRRRSASPSSTNDANPELSARTPYVQTPSSFPGASGSETTQAGKNSPKGKKSLQSQSQKRRRSPPSALDRAKAALGRRKPNVREDKIYPNELQRRAAEALTSAPLVMAGSLGLNQQSGPGPTSGSGSNPGAKSTRNKRGAARKPKPSATATTTNNPPSPLTLPAASAAQREMLPPLTQTPTTPPRNGASSGSQTPFSTRRAPRCSSAAGPRCRISISTRCSAERPRRWGWRCARERLTPTPTRRRIQM